MEGILESAAHCRLLGLGMPFWAGERCEDMKNNWREVLKECTLCPRNCRVDRTAGEKGFCKETDEVMAARAALHMWEEPCISGTQGSGTVFFSGCSLRCVFCQNASIASGSIGKPIHVERLSEIFLELQSQGAANINLVTPGHFAPIIVEALDLAKKEGLKLPVVYNSSGYESIQTLRHLEGYVDVYLPDFKYMNPVMAAKYSHAPEYPLIAKKAVEEMVRQTGACQFDENGMIKKGTIVRHLVLPGYSKDSMKVVEYLYTTYKDQIFISLMNQYTPLPRAADYPELNRRVTTYEYDKVISYALSLGVTNGYMQKGKTAKESFIPAFDFQGIEKEKGIK